MDDDSQPGEDGGHRPLRRCLATGERLPKSALLRFVVSPDGRVVFDVNARLPGRGLWLKPGRDMIETAATKGLFSKAARRSVIVPDGLATQVTAGLKRRCLDRLGLARRAGLVAMGFEKVRARIAEGGVALLLEARDGAADGRRKVTGLAPHIAVLDVFTGDELGHALGRDHVVHVALGADKLTDLLCIDCERLHKMRPEGRPEDR